MASSLETKVLYNEQVNTLPVPVTHFRNQEIQVPRVKPQIHRPEPKRQEAAPAQRKNYSRLTIGLIAAAFTLLASEAVIYFHSVQVQKNANLMQGKIVEIKEQNYRLNVELAKTKELTRVEQVAVRDLGMKPSLNSKINYLILPEVVTEKEYLITRVQPEQKKLSIPVGY